MEFFKANTHIPFLKWRKITTIFSIVLIIVSLSSLFVRGLNFGIDFTGGTLVEITYDESADVDQVRGILTNNGFSDAQVQYFGSARDVLVRIPVTEKTAAEISSQIIELVRKPYNETLFKGNVVGESTEQRCVTDGASETAACRVQMKRIEFVGPQVGNELAEKGTLAMIYALIGILIYVGFRFEWRFSLGSVAALVHDVIITLGFFSLFQVEFNLPVLAAILAVVGYSLNDTIVVFDRIRENFRRLRKGTAEMIMDQSINQTLSRTILTSSTTLFVILALMIFGGEVLRGFSIALFVGIFVGTYSSIFIASPTVLLFGIQKEHLMPIEKEGADQSTLI